MEVLQLVDYAAMSFSSTGRYLQSRENQHAVGWPDLPRVTTTNLHQQTPSSPSGHNRLSTERNRTNMRGIGGGGDRVLKKRGGAEDLRGFVLGKGMIDTRHASCYM